MPWSIAYDEPNSLLHVVFTGDITGADLHEATTEVIGMAHERRSIRFLVDFAGAISRATTLAVWSLPAQQYPDEGLARNSRVAMLLPENQKTRDDIRFYETACVNRGWQVKCFSGQEEARRWLCDDATPARL